MRSIRKAIPLLFCAGIALASSAVAAETEGMSFERVLQIHLTGIRDRNLAAIERTLTSGKRLDLFLPNGDHLRTREEFIKLHIDWFADRSWRWRYEPVAQHVGHDLATATIKTYSESRDSEGKVTRWSENWLTLTFRKEDGGWALILDQNTPIARGPRESAEAARRARRPADTAACEGDGFGGCALHPVSST